MFKVGDLVRHKTTGITGKVIGFGHRRISDRFFFTHSQSRTSIL